MRLSTRRASVDRTVHLRQELKDLISDRAIKHGEFTLASGKRSSYYINCRMVTLSPRGAWLVGNLIFEMLRGTGVKAIGGPTIGADPIATAVAIVSSERRKPISAFIVRKEPKAHGEMLQIEGPLPDDPDARVVIVEDVVTTGGSILRAVDAVRAHGLEVARVIALVDRMEGAAEALADKDVEFTPIFRIDELGV